MLTSQQSKVNPLEYLCSGARGVQAGWLFSRQGDEPMPDDQRVKFDEKVKEAIKKWQDALKEGDESVGGICVAP
jgi:hypothetical protein